MARSLSRRDLTFVVIPMSACWLQAVLSTAKARTARIPLDFLRMKPPNLTHTNSGPNGLKLWFPEVARSVPPSTRQHVEKGRRESWPISAAEIRVLLEPTRQTL